MIVTKFDSVFIAKKTLHSIAKRCVPELKRLANATYQDVRASVCLPLDRGILHVVEAAIDLKKKLHPELIVVVGIGGSNLGTMAVQEALLGRWWNLHHVPKVLYADTVDPDALQVIVEGMQRVLRQGRQVLLNVVSKSGETTETVANFEVLYNVLRHHRKDAERYVVATTDKDSALWHLALQKDFSLLEIPKLVGGRYSVFSAVGLFPLGLLGVDLRQLLAGAAWMREQCLSSNTKINPAALAAAAVYDSMQKGMNVYDLFFFSEELESLGKWCRQLIAESLGKEFDLRGKRVNVGITPTVCVGSTDLHSMGQLDLSGPRDKLTHFVVAHFDHQLKVPLYPEFDRLVPNLQKKELGKIMRAIADGVKAAYRKSKRPFLETRLATKDAYCVGAFMQLMMVQTILAGSLLRVNPFDQPGVEKYKRETRRFLAGRKA
ncbi:hypothetical protein HY489_05300 [Candidatus Woesearchaeota archaeon]|nr:hypothetical protein [Candidatus Woesearchaeota archaeon]